MIVRESVAVCEGCGHKEPLPEERNAHPSTWPALVDETGQHHYCSHTCLVRAAAGPDSRNPSLRAYPLGLTYLEVRILEQIAMGLSNKEAAASLGIVVSTLKNHLTDANKKLGTADRLQAVLRAHALGIVNLNQLSRRVMPHYPKDQAA